MDCGTFFAKKVPHLQKTPIRIDKNTDSLVFGIAKKRYKIHFSLSSGKLFGHLFLEKGAKKSNHKANYANIEDKQKRRGTAA